MIEFDERMLVGSGAFANVYRVKKDDEYFALKEIEDKSLRDREAKFLKLADHPLFPKYYQSYDEDTYYILREYVWGENFADCIARRGGFSQPECMRFAIAVADGISFLQQSDGNILFRDLKAENLILQPDGSLRLCDLGAACFLSEAHLSMAGTKGDSAPEQIMDPGGQGMYSDVYAFGKLFYHMLTGKKADPDDDTVSIRAVDPGFSACLELLIRQCCAYDPVMRIPDMYSVLSRLTEIATQSPRGYRKMERKAERELRELESGQQVTFSRNVQS